MLLTMMLMTMTGDAGLLNRGLHVERQNSRDEELEMVGHEAHHQTQSKSKKKTVIATFNRA